MRPQLAPISCFTSAAESSLTGLGSVTLGEWNDFATMLGVLLAPELPWALYGFSQRRTDAHNLITDSMCHLSQLSHEGRTSRSARGLGPWLLPGLSPLWKNWPSLGCAGDYPCGSLWEALEFMNVGEMTTCGLYSIMGFLKKKTEQWLFFKVIYFSGILSIRT